MKIKRKKIMTVKRWLQVEIVFLLVLLLLMLGKFFLGNSLEETSSPEESKNKEWWLNSGAFVEKTKEGFSTWKGPIPLNSKWKDHYAQNNPEDTLNGTYPQNIFRLISKQKGQDIEEQVTARILTINAIDSKNRYESNGILLFQRYEDQNNLYYAGIRVDGNAVIKKKVNGTYYTLAINKVYSGTYDRQQNSSLIPLHQWIGLKSRATNTLEGNVFIELFMDLNNTAHWKKVLEVIDDGTLGGKPLKNEARTGIRTDFMDVEFKNLSIHLIESNTKKTTE